MKVTVKVILSYKVKKSEPQTILKTSSAKSFLQSFFKDEKQKKKKINKT